MSQISLHIIHGIILQEIAKFLETSERISRGPKWDTSGECDTDSGSETEERECRVAVINFKKFPTSPNTIISVEGVTPRTRFHAGVAHPILSKHEVYTHVNP